MYALFFMALGVAVAGYALKKARYTLAVLCIIFATFAASAVVRSIMFFVDDVLRTLEA